MLCIEFSCLIVVGFRVRRRQAASGGSIKLHLTSVRRCWKRCETDPSCVGFDWQRAQMTCTHHTASTINNVYCNITSHHYVKVHQCPRGNNDSDEQSESSSQSSDQSVDGSSQESDEHSSDTNSSQSSQSSSESSSQSSDESVDGSSQESNEHSSDTSSSQSSQSSS